MGRRGTYSIPIWDQFIPCRVANLLLVPFWDLMYPDYRREIPILRVVGVDHICEFLETRPMAPAGQILAWLGEIESAQWRSLADLRSAFPRALLDGSSVTFLISERTIAITTLIRFQIPLVLVTRVSQLKNYAHLSSRRHL
jgi:mRNA-degrading endonuclease HigB of HigAB toxin-antitoxin module